MSSRGHFSGSSWLETAVALSLFHGSTDTRAARLLKQLRESDAGTDVADADLPDWLAQALRMRATDRHARLADLRERARAALALGDQAGLVALTWRDAAFPARLGHIPDPPIVLWVRGDVAHLSAPAVAVVGSRDATPPALAIARRLGHDLAAAGLLVVSGMARGVDGAAHEGALAAGAPTIAVLGCGADVVYPYKHAALAQAMAARGAIVSELVPGTPPRPAHFPLRNRIISGLSLAVVVVEASEKSGSLITARAALDQGRDVLAVPGGVLSGRSRGCHALIRDGARIVETARDIFEHLNWKAPTQAARTGADNSLQLNGLEGTMAVGESYSVDDLASGTGRPASALLAELGALELSGKVMRTAGGLYLRLD